jgi:phage regulator Rha-like protein
MGNIVELRGTIPVTTSLKIAEGVGIEHESVMRLLKEYQHTDLLSRFEIGKVKTRGRPVAYAVLDEEQATFLITLMRNSEQVVKFKQALVKEFFRQRKVIMAMRNNHADAEWKQQRVEGKMRYMQKVDVIKQFVEYATAQGSQNAERYYSNLATMENRALFFLEQRYSNVREMLDLRQLMIVGVADDVVEKALKEGMLASLHYKECYELAKDRVLALSAVVGKSPVQKLLEMSE